MSNKKFKNIIKKQKTISIIGASRKLGVTHICLCLANFLASALKQRVLYIELSEESQLLGFVGDKQIKIHNQTAFFYKNVNYVLSCSAVDAMSLINNFDGYVIVDISKYSEDTRLIFKQCDKRIVIGSMKPWCFKDIDIIMSKLKGELGIKIKFYNLSSNKNEINEFKTIYNQSMEALPYIDNPFALKEENFDSLIKMIE